VDSLGAGQKGGAGSEGNQAFGGESGIALGVNAIDETVLEVDIDDGAALEVDGEGRTALRVDGKSGVAPEVGHGDETALG